MQEEKSNYGGRGSDSQINRRPINKEVDLIEEKMFKFLYTLSLVQVAERKYCDYGNMRSFRMNYCTSDIPLNYLGSVLWSQLEGSRAICTSS